MTILEAHPIYVWKFGCAEFCNRTYKLLLVEYISHISEPVIVKRHFKYYSFIKAYVTSATLSSSHS